jgi:hypothetical protein
MNKSAIPLFWRTCAFVALSVGSLSFTLGGENPWTELEPILRARVQQSSPKMKLKPAEAEELRVFLTEQLYAITPHLTRLKLTLPKTTLELLMAVNRRGLEITEAEKMAEYLQSVLQEFQFSNPGAFDENTSHIIGREWSEIDYSGEGMTWQKQKAKYKPYGIDHFKSVECLKKFIPVESRLPYFKKAYGVARKHPTQKKP